MITPLRRKLRRGFFVAACLGTWYLRSQFVTSRRFGSARGPSQRSQFVILKSHRRRPGIALIFALDPPSSLAEPASLPPAQPARPGCAPAVPTPARNRGLRGGPARPRSAPAPRETPSPGSPASASPPAPSPPTHASRWRPPAGIGPRRGGRFRAARGEEE
jgi:hypothetical protein